jgi:hypothetical protein
MRPRNHLARHIGGAVDVVACAGRHVVHEDLFGVRLPIRMAICAKIIQP